MSEKKYDAILLTGGFDPLHTGHLDMIEDAARKCDIIVLGINNDDWLKEKKGFVFMNELQRVRIMRSLKFKIHVFLFPGDAIKMLHVFNILRNWHNDIISDNKGFAFGNGGDRTSDNIPEEELEFCKENDIDLLFGLGGEKTESSSDLVNRLGIDIKNTDPVYRELKEMKKGYLYRLYDFIKTYAKPDVFTERIYFNVEVLSSGIKLSKESIFKYIKMLDDLGYIDYNKFNNVFSFRILK